jgi:phosphohistidine phosphatase SixA
MRIFLSIAAALFAGLTLVAQPNEAPATVFLVRHAERSGPAMEDPITAAGQVRAELLARMFSEAGVTRIVTSDYRRTRETAAPLAKKLGLTPVVVKGGDDRVVAKALADTPAGTATVAVRHSGEIERTLEQFGAAYKVPKILETEYDRLLILTFQNGKLAALRTLRYGAPSNTN